MRHPQTDEIMNEFCDRMIENSPPRAARGGLS